MIRRHEVDRLKASLLREIDSKGSAVVNLELCQRSERQAIEELEKARIIEQRPDSFYNRAVYIRVSLLERLAMEAADPETDPSFTGIEPESE